jgi:hypothetical protein
MGGLWAKLYNNNKFEIFCFSNRTATEYDKSKLIGVTMLCVHVLVIYGILMLMAVNGCEIWKATDCTGQPTPAERNSIQQVRQGPHQVIFG